MPTEQFSDVSAICTPEEEEAFKALEQQQAAESFVGPKQPVRVETSTMHDQYLQERLLNNRSHSTPFRFEKR